MTVTILQGDCREVLKTLPDASVHACVTDPPYDLTAGKNGGTGVASVNLESPYGRARIGTGNGPGGFMGMKWDGTGVAFDPATWAEVLRVLKPGGHLLSFGGTRTYHRMACAIEDAGFEIRDQIGWLYGSGFPKSHNGPWGGTALKPAWEPIVLARKPLVGTVAANVLEHGTGALNINACRIPVDDAAYARNHSGDRGHAGTRESIDTGATNIRAGGGSASDLGRWPANIVHDGSDEVLQAFPLVSSGKAHVRRESGADRNGNTSAAYGAESRPSGSVMVSYGDTGSAARFFYCAKADRNDRNEGLDGMPERRVVHQAQTLNNGSGGLRNGDGLPSAQRNHHPTVKPTNLMRWLCRLVTPPGGTVLDPFMGSGSTLKAAELEGFSAIGIELSPEYIDIARRRIATDAPLFAEVL